MKNSLLILLNAENSAIEEYNYALNCADIFQKEITKSKNAEDIERYQDRIECYQKQADEAMICILTIRKEIKAYLETNIF